MENNETLWFKSKSGKPLHFSHRLNPGTTKDTYPRHIEGVTKYYYLDIDEEMANNNIPVPAFKGFNEFASAEGSLILVDERDARPIYEKFMAERKAKAETVKEESESKRGRPKKEVA